MSTTLDLPSLPEQSKQHSTVRTVAPNIHLVRLPLPFALNHVNCYLLQDDEGWTMLDTGLDRPEIRQAWQETFVALEIEPQQIRQIVLTHMHPDHYGLSGFFQAITGAPVYLSPREAELANAVWVQNAWDMEQVNEYWRMGGIPQEVRRVIASQTQKLRQMTMPHPHEVHLIHPGDLISMGGRTFRAILAPGHSDGQLVFYDEADRLMICGDQVLKSITPNIGLWPSTAFDPLGRYLASLAELAQLDVRLALPGHGSVITEWKARIQALLEHHAQRLDHMRDAVGGSATALDVSRRVFDFDSFSEHEVRFAVAETLAHLEHLVLHGRIGYSDNGLRTYMSS